ncbi:MULTISPECIES: hypothetical protein [unclassified Crossiella]|uniref:hypothetical protein n=1 Tax=unclassified Crossiella TaxID=2620835 RepID=UPI001FFE7C39|nr:MULTISPECIES: hypothetical protein [unclassified Crossiella]MCK2243686.1 hypothetical protein [Crossiella sp. S99.2]MCK2257545.1 hypothetical protein [Crossiella sp. S99.1]
MNDNHIATVGELIAALATQDPASPVRIATCIRLPVGPQSPVHHQVTVGTVVSAPDEDAEAADLPVVWLGGGKEVGWPFHRDLPPAVATALRWS